MAFTTGSRLRAIINQSQFSVQQSFADEGIDNAADGANAYLQKVGVPSTETDEGLLQAADRLAMSFLLEGLILQRALRGQSQATGSLRILSDDLRKSALDQAQTYVVYTTRTTSAVNNRNWAHDRGGPLRRGSEAGEYKRTTR